MSKHTRDELLYLAKLAEQCERYDGKYFIDSALSCTNNWSVCVEMVEYTQSFAQAGEQEMILEERNILSVAFKNVVGTRRAAWRVLSSIQKKENNKGKYQKAF